jgi:hypothetical protein
MGKAEIEDYGQSFGFMGFLCELSLHLQTIASYFTFITGLFLCYTYVLCVF